MCHKIVKNVKFVGRPIRTTAPPRRQTMLENLFVSYEQNKWWWWWWWLKSYSGGLIVLTGIVAALVGGDRLGGDRPTNWTLYCGRARTNLPSLTPSWAHTTTDSN